MVGGHKVLVAAEEADREAARAVGVEIAGGLDPEVELFRRVRQERFIESGRCQVKLIVVCLVGADAFL